MLEILVHVCACLAGFIMPCSVLLVAMDVKCLNRVTHVSVLTTGGLKLIFREAFLHILELSHK